MAGVPPQIFTETGTPASEWAQSTTTATFARDEPAPAMTSTLTNASLVSTPGQEVPGAYPKTPGDEVRASATGISGWLDRTPTEHQNNVDVGDTTNKAMQTASSVAQGLTGVAQSAASQAANVASSATQYVAENAPSYLPASLAEATAGTTTAVTHEISASEHDATHTKSFPSSETTGAGEREHVGGAGALPGSVNEQGVAALPDEKGRERDPIGDYAAASSTTGKPDSINIAGTYPSGPYAPVTSDTTHAVPGGPSVWQHTTLPSQEKSGIQPNEHQDGVGALPGKITEEGVAALPDEKHVGFDTLPTQEQFGNEELRGGRPANVEGVGNLVGGVAEENVASLPDERGEGEKPVQASQGVTGKAKDATQQTKQAAQHAKDATKETMKKAVPGTTSKQESDRDTDIQSAQHKLPSDTNGHTQDTAPGASTAAATQPPQHDIPAAPRDADKTKKTGFMSKMKGEAKILLGKVEGKKGHDKIQEGKQLKGEA